MNVISFPALNFGIKYTKNIMNSKTKYSLKKSSIYMHVEKPLHMPFNKWNVLAGRQYMDKINII